jgi:hypothetical protein
MGYHHIFYADTVPADRAGPVVAMAVKIPEEREESFGETGVESRSAAVVKVDLACCWPFRLPVPE